MRLGEHVHYDGGASRAPPATQHRGEVARAAQPLAWGQHEPTAGLGDSDVAGRVGRDQAESSRRPLPRRPLRMSGRPGYASAAGSRASWPGDGCSAERSACSR